MTKEKPPDFSGGFFVAESIELSNLNEFVRDFLEVIEFYLKHNHSKELAALTILKQ